jgi:ParB family chromosome partitioning protein
MIPLCQLTRSKINVRKTGATADIAALAASIEAHGLLENLIVSKSPNDAEPPNYQVIAGGKRLAALKFLVRRKKIARDHPVHCQVRNGAMNLTELSLAENFVRAPLHPADQFEAFARLQADGLSAGDIAARFGLSTTLVRQRLKLAAVSPRLMAEYRNEAMTLEQLMAFTISDDHKAQDEVWARYPHQGFAPHMIRRLLTSAHVDGSDRRARFIGAKAYEEAGGIIARDLFQEESEGYFTDSQLLDRLVAQRLEAEAEAIRPEGWSWVEVWPERDFDLLNRCGRAKTVAVELSKKEAARLVKLGDRYDVLVEQIEDDGPSEVAEELDGVTAELEALQAKTVTWSDNEKALSGAVVLLDPEGGVEILRGLIRPGDRKREQTEDSGKERRPAGAYSDALLTDLSANRTAALRELLAGSPETALTALLEVLVRTAFYDAYRQGCVRISAVLVELGRHAKSLGESKASQALFARHAGWQERLPAEEALWPWLEELSRVERFKLLAHCVALTLDAVWRRNGDGDLRGDSEHLARILALDMSQWWRPERANYLDHVTKDQIVAAVTEAVSGTEGRRLAGLKKSDMAERAQALLAGTGWLPEPLRALNLETQATD